MKKMMAKKIITILRLMLLLIPESLIIVFRENNT